jgi:ADP-ribose pyrophosphatase
VLTEVIHLFLARDLDATDARPEEHEVFEARWVPLDEAVELAASGRLQDAKSLIGLLWARAKLRGAG